MADEMFHSGPVWWTSLGLFDCFEDFSVSVSRFVANLLKYFGVLQISSLAVFLFYSRK